MCRKNGEVGESGYQVDWDGELLDKVDHLQSD